jgi:hypothetical protein
MILECLLEEEPGIEDCLGNENFKYCQVKRQENPKSELKSKVRRIIDRASCLKAIELKLEFLHH